MPALLDVDGDAERQEQETREQGSFHQQNVPSVRFRSNFSLSHTYFSTAETQLFLVSLACSSQSAALTYFPVLRNQ